MGVLLATVYTILGISATAWLICAFVRLCTYGEYFLMPTALWFRRVLCGIFPPIYRIKEEENGTYTILRNGRNLKWRVFRNVGNKDMYSRLFTYWNSGCGAWSLNRNDRRSSCHLDNNQRPYDADSYSFECDRHRNVVCKTQVGLTDESMAENLVTILSNEKFFRKEFAVRAIYPAVSGDGKVIGFCAPAFNQTDEETFKFFVPIDIPIVKKLIEMCDKNFKNENDDWMIVGQETVEI